MLFNYKILQKDGQTKVGQIDAANRDVAITSLQESGFVIISLNSAAKKNGLLQDLSIFNTIPNKDIVVMSRQFASLFEAQIPVIRAFELMSMNVTNRQLKDILMTISEDVKAGESISKSLAKHPKAFSEFYVNMVSAGEESGSLGDTFIFLADYLERNFELFNKTKNALIYPAFVIVTFIGVMVLMLTLVIPKLTAILIESGQPIPFYTQVVIWLSNVFVHYGYIVALIVVILVVVITKGLRSANGKYRFDKLKLQLPFFKNMYQMLYLSRISDNLSTMLSSGIPVVRALEITSKVIDNRVYEDIIMEAANGVKSGDMISDTFLAHKELPAIMVNMIKIGEETGTISSILKKLSVFYRREVNDSIDTIIGLIEPAMVVLLGLGVGFLLSAVLLPIYSVTSSL